MTRVLALLLAALAGAGCAPAAPLVAPLRVRPVDWNPGHADVPPVRAVADAGPYVVAFGDGAATVFSAGRVVGVDRSVPRWIAAGTIPAPDGAGTWIVGVDGDGRVRRLLGEGRLDPVSDRFGLGGEYVLGVVSLGGAGAAFRLSREIAVADGKDVVRYATGPLAALAGGGGRAALVGDPLRVLGAATQRVGAFDLPDRPAYVTVTAQGKLFAATADAIWGEDDRGDLRLRFQSGGLRLHGLAAAGERVWFADGAELGVIEGGRVRETRGAKISGAAELSASPSGDVWTLTGGSLARWAVADGDAPDWDADVAPIFRRACAACHLPGGAAQLDLGSKEAWDRHRVEIRQRVLVDRTMPPTGLVLPEPDRAVIRAFLDGAAPPGR
jgi:mono/diheme cytochrome c family protein